MSNNREEWDQVLNSLRTIKLSVPAIIQFKEYQTYWKKKGTRMVHTIEIQKGAVGKLEIICPSSNTGYARMSDGIMRRVDLRLVDFAKPPQFKLEQPEVKKEVQSCPEEEHDSLDAIYENMYA